MHRRLHRLEPGHGIRFRRGGGRGGRCGLLGEKGREGQEQHGKNRQGGVQCFVHFGWVRLNNQGNALGRPHGGETAQVAPEHGKPVEPSE